MAEFLSKKQIFLITIGDSDFRGRVKISALLNYCQTIASDHAEELGAGRDDLLKRGLVWILSRTSFKISRWPVYGERIAITTLPLKAGRAEAIRDYYFEDEKGQNIVSASSMWCVIDANKKIIRRCDVYPQDESLFTTDIIFKDANLKLDAEKTRETRSLAYSGTVNLSEIDENEHMNNAKYGDVIMNCLDFKEFADRTIDRFDINFLSELKKGDVYKVFRTDNGDTTLIEAETNDKTAFRASLHRSLSIAVNKA